MAYLLHEVAAGRQSLRAPVRITRRDAGRNGSGIMQFFYLHRSIELYNLLVMMITISDNVATNVLVRRLGKERINAYARSLGLLHTEIVMDFLDFADDYRSQGAPVGRSTAREMTTLVRRMITGDLLSSAHTTLTRKLLQNVQVSFVKRGLSLSADVNAGLRDFGSKTGWLDDADRIIKLAECGFLVDPAGKECAFSMFLSSKLDADLPYGLDSVNHKLFVKLFRALCDELVNSA